MYRAPRLLLAFLLGSGMALPPASSLMASSPEDPASSPRKKATLQPVAATAPDVPFNVYETQAEQQLLYLANQSRHQAGLAPLSLDSGLSAAARAHAQIMLSTGQLSHRFDGEASLAQRLAEMTTLQLDQEGENVALDYDAEHGHEHLMLSAPHRANLLNAQYNVVGLGVVRSGDRLYIVQDFAHSVPSSSIAEWKNKVGSTINDARRKARLPELRRRDLLVADEAACSMAKADMLGTDPVHKLAERFTVLTYTGLHAETLPDGALHAVTGNNLQSFSIGACYARTDTYPTGVYWVVVTVE